jgi:hypothetical protein
MSVYVYSVFVLCVGSGLATGSSPVQGVLSTVYRFKKLKKAAKAQRAVEPCREREKSVLSLPLSYVWIWLFSKYGLRIIDVVTCIFPLNYLECVIPV